jgi:Calx-beta domain/Bacterial Ig-like domain
LTVNAGNAFRVLDSAAPRLNLSGFTITGGKAIDSDGGGLRASGNVILDKMVITGNAATGDAWRYTGKGGGIGMNPGAFLTVKNSTISGNTAGINGGGIGFYYGGSLVVENSTISGNSSTSAGSFSYGFRFDGGGGIQFSGAISNAPPTGYTPGVVVIRNSTIANNTTTGLGGGILMTDANGTLSLQDSTVSGNSADSFGTSERGYPLGGGGIKRLGYSGDISLANSVVAGNTNADSPDIGSRGLVSVNFSAVGSTAGFTVTGANNILDADPMLGPLQDNGGPTLTMAPLSGSPLIDGGSNALVPAGISTDQRGGSFDRILGSAVDIGSFEAQPTRVTIDQAASQADPTNGSAIAFTVHFSSAVTGFGGTDIDFTGSTVSGTLVAGVTGTGADYTVAVTGMTGEGTIVASIPAEAATDLLGANTTASTSTDNTVTFDGLPPAVTIDQSAGQADPTKVGPITFTVHFSEIVTEFDGTDVSFTGSTVGGTLVASVTGSGADYTVAVTGMTGKGTVVASLPAGATVDAAGNESTTSTSTDNSVIFDNIAPSVTIDQAVGQSDPTNDASIKFDVKFSEAVTGFDASDVSVVGSTAGGTLAVSVSGSGNTYTVTVTGMSNRGLVVASIPAGAASDAAGNLSFAATSTDNTVEFANTGAVGFTSAIYDTNEEAGTISITVSRTGGVEGAVTIQFATSNGSAHSGGSATNGQADYTPVNGTLSWADGESGDKAFDIPILQDTLNEGKELINLTLANPTGSPSLGIAAATVAIIASDGDLPGKYVDQDGDKYTIKLNGKTGSLLWFRTDPDGDGKGPIELIELTDTLPDPLKPKATLAVTVTKVKTSTDGGTVGLGAIMGTGLKSISARKSNLNLEGVNLSGYLGALTIGNISNGADITILATTNPKQKTSINALAIGDGTAIDIGAVVSSLTAMSFGNGSFKAPSVGTMTIKGNMAADVTISGVGADPTKKALSTLKVTGAVTGSDIFVTGNVGNVSVGAFRDSRLFAGYSGPDNGIGGNFNFAATVNKFSSTGKTDGFQNSQVIATNFKTVTIKNLDSTNSASKFGFYAHASLGAINVLGPTKFKYNAALPTPQGIGDFEVKIV